MKVYTNLIVWVDFDPDKKRYLLGYAGCDDVIVTVSIKDADILEKVIWELLHSDKREDKFTASIEERLCREEQK